MGNNTNIQGFFKERGYSITRLADEIGYARESINNAIKRGWFSYGMWKACCEALGEDLDIPHHERRRKHTGTRRHEDAKCFVCGADIFGSNAYCGKCRPEQTRLDAEKIQSAPNSAYVGLANAILKLAFEDLEDAMAKEDTLTEAQILRDIKSDWFRSLLYGGQSVEELMEYVEPVRRSHRKRRCHTGDRSK